MIHKFNIRYTVGGEKRILSVEASGPFRALDRFHFLAQTEFHHNPEDYKITELALTYNDDPQGRTCGNIVESTYDLPASCNPTIVIGKGRSISEPTNEVVMPFMSEVLSGRLSQ